MFGFQDLLTGKAFRPDPANVYCSLEQKLPRQRAVGVVFTSAEIFLAQISFNAKGEGQIQGDPVVVPRHERKEFDAAIKKFNGSAALVVIDEPGLEHEADKLGLAIKWHEVEPVIRHNAEEVLSEKASNLKSYRAVANKEFDSALVFESRQSAVDVAVEWVEDSGFTVSVVTSPLMVMFAGVVNSGIPANCDILIASKGGMMVIPVRDREWDLAVRRYLSQNYDYDICKGFLEGIKDAAKEVIVVSGAGVPETLLDDLRKDFPDRNVNGLFGSALPEMEALLATDNGAEGEGPIDIRRNPPKPRTHLNAKLQPVVWTWVAMFVLSAVGVVAFWTLNLFASSELKEQSAAVSEMKTVQSDTSAALEKRKKAIADHHRLIEWSRNLFSTQGLLLELAKQTDPEVLMEDFEMELPDDGEVVIRIALTGSQAALEEQMLRYNKVFQSMGWREIASDSPKTASGLQFSGRYKIEEQI